MKKLLIIVILVMISGLTYACSGNKPTETPDINATAQAIAAQKETESALTTAQTAIVATQKAMVMLPTTVPPTNPVVPTAQTGMETPPTTVSTVPIASPSMTEVTCPFYVYQNWGSDLNHYVPEGWMGDTSDIKFDDNYKLDPNRPNVIQIKFTPMGKNQWAGIYWWNPPASNFGAKDGGFDLSCATKLTFWARGEKGGEKAEFKVGGIKGAYQDSLQPAYSTGPIILTNHWVQYTLDLTGKDLSHVIGGFVWVTNKPSNPSGATIYLDDIMFEH